MRKIYIILVCVLALVSCTEELSMPEKTAHISLNPSIEDIVDVRSIINNSTFPISREIKAFAYKNGTVYFSNETFCHDLGIWSPSTPLFWPPDANLDILAHSAGSATVIATSTNNQTLSLSSTDLTADDVLAGTIHNACEWNQSILFRHALSKVKFSADASDGSLIKIKSIVLNAVKGGSITFSTHNDGTKPEFTTTLSGSAVAVPVFSGNLTVAERTSGYSDITQETLIPEQKPSVTVTFTMTKGAVESGQYTATVDLFTCKAEHSYDIRLSFDEDNLTFTTSLIPWINTEPNELVSTVTSVTTVLIYDFAGETKEVDLPVASGSYTVDYFINGGRGASNTAPEGLSVSLQSSSPTRRYAISLDTAPVESSFTFDGSWPADTKYNTPLGSASSPVDLSMYDVQGNRLIARETANTYIVHAPGTYMIPLVYGNAIRNGVSNEDSYTVRTEGSSEVWATINNGIIPGFWNAYDTQISSPWIVTDAAANGKQVTSAALTWSNRPGLVSVNPALRTEGGVKFLVFTVDPATIGFGSAVVEARDEDGTVVWAWHVWVYGDEIYDNEVQPFPEYGSPRAITFLCKPLGYIPSPGTGSVYAPFDAYVRFRAAGVGDQVYRIVRKRTRRQETFDSNLRAPWYQYGRPVPQPDMDIDGYPVYETTAVHIYEALRSPGTFYKTSVSYIVGGHHDGDEYPQNHWNLNPSLNQYTKNDDMPVVKTVYDPSPAGYTIPRMKDFMFVGTRNEESYTSDSYGDVEVNAVDMDKNGKLEAWVHNSPTGDYRYGWFLKRWPEDTKGFHLPCTDNRAGSSGAEERYASFVGWTDRRNTKIGGKSQLCVYTNGKANGFAVLPVRENVKQNGILTPWSTQSISEIEFPIE